MKRAKITTLATRDLSEIYAYIAENNPARALHFVQRLHRQCDVLASSPGIGRRREDFGAGLRSFPVGKYLIFYRQIEDEVQILRVLHGMRDLASIFDNEDDTIQ